MECAVRVCCVGGFDHSNKIQNMLMIAVLALLLSSFSLGQTNISLTPTISPSPAQVMFSTNLTISGAFLNYFGNEFNASASQNLIGEMIPISLNNMDLDLALQIKVGSAGGHWNNVQSSTSISSREQIAFTTLSGGIYRWRIYVYSGASPQKMMNITFKSNVASSIAFENPTFAPTLPPTTQSPTLSPTSAPTVFLFTKEITILSEKKDYLGSPFTAAASRLLSASFFPNSISNMDLDLYLEMDSGASWTRLRSSTGTRSNESISFTTVSSGIYRWRIFVYKSIAGLGLQMNITFKSNIQESINFTAQIITLSPTLAPTTTRSPTLSPTAAPTIFLFAKEMTILSGKKNYPGSPFTAASSQLLFANFFPISNSTMDLDLYLEMNNGTTWTRLRSSASTRSTESISFTTVSSGIYRWRIYVFGSHAAGLQMNITFRSNIQAASNFGEEATASPTFLPPESAGGTGSAAPPSPASAPEDSSNTAIYASIGVVALIGALGGALWLYKKKKSPPNPLSSPLILTNLPK